MPQRLANGLKTRLAPSAPDDAEQDFETARGSTSTFGDATDKALKEERLRAVQLANRKAYEDELARKGRYIPVADARSAAVKAANTVSRTYEAAIVAIVGVIAARHGLDPREVKSFTRSQLRPVLERAAAEAKFRAEEIGSLCDDDPDQVLQ